MGVKILTFSQHGKVGAAGLCQAALSALRNHRIDVHGKVLGMLCAFQKDLCSSERCSNAESTLEELLDGGIVETAVTQMATAECSRPDGKRQSVAARRGKAECEESGGGLEMLVLLSRDSDGLQSMCEPRPLYRLMEGIAKWLVQVWLFCVFVGNPGCCGVIIRDGLFRKFVCFHCGQPKSFGWVLYVVFVGNRECCGVV